MWGIPNTSSLDVQFGPSCRTVLYGKIFVDRQTGLSTIFFSFCSEVRPQTGLSPCADHIYKDISYLSKWLIYM